MFLNPSQKDELRKGEIDRARAEHREPDFQNCPGTAGVNFPGSYNLDTGVYSPPVDEPTDSAIIITPVAKPSKKKEEATKEFNLNDMFGDGK